MRTKTEAIHLAWLCKHTPSFIFVGIFILYFNVMFCFVFQKCPFVCSKVAGGKGGRVAFLSSVLISSGGHLSSTQQKGSNVAFESQMGRQLVLHAYVRWVAAIT